MRLYDIDREAALRNETIGNKISAHPEAKSRWKYTVADSLQQALTGADFTVISILPASFKEMRSDVHAPERLGIYQPVGDTVGPGGFMRAVRTMGVRAIEMQSALSGNSIFAIDDQAGQHDVARKGRCCS